MKGSSRGVLVAIERPKGPVGVNGTGIAEEPPPPVAPAEPREKAVKDGCKNSEGQYLTSLVCRSGPSDSRCQHRIHRSAPVPAARSTGIPTPRSGRPRRCQQQHCSHQPRICRPCDHTWGQSQGRGTGLAAKAVTTQGKGTGLAAKKKRRLNRRGVRRGGGARDRIPRPAALRSGVLLVKPCVCVCLCAMANVLHLCPLKLFVCVCG